MFLQPCIEHDHLIHLTVLPLIPTATCVGIPIFLTLPPPILSSRRSSVGSPMLGITLHPDRSQERLRWLQAFERPWSSFVTSSAPPASAPATLSSTTPLPHPSISSTAMSTNSSTVTARPTLLRSHLLNITTPATASTLTAGSAGGGGGGRAALSYDSQETITDLLSRDTAEGKEERDWWARNTTSSIETVARNVEARMLEAQEVEQRQRSTSALLVCGARLERVWQVGWR